MTDDGVATQDGGSDQLLPVNTGSGQETAAEPVANKNRAASRAMRCSKACGLMSGVFYLFPWALINFYVPFLIGWKKFYLAGAIDLLEGSFQKPAAYIALIQLGMGCTTALATFGFMSANVHVINRKVAGAHYPLLMTFLSTTPLCFLLAKQSFDIDGQKNFGVFAIAVILSGIGDGAYNAFASGSLSFFYTNDHRRSRLVTSQISEAVGIAYGLYWGRSENEVIGDVQSYSGDVFLVFFYAYCVAVILLLMAFVYNLTCRCGFRFRFFPSHFKASFLEEDAASKNAAKGIPEFGCCKPMQDMDEDEVDTAYSGPSKMWLFQALTVAQAFSVFTKNGLLFWGIRDMEQTFGLTNATSANARNSTLDLSQLVTTTFCLEIIIGCAIGALLALAFLKFHASTVCNLAVRACIFTAPVFGLCVAALACCLALSQVETLGVGQLFAVFGTSYATYFVCVTFCHAVIDEVQLELIRPSLRSVGVTAELLAEEIIDAVSPLLVVALSRVTSLKYAMLGLLPTATALGVASLVVLAALAQRFKVR